MFDIQRVAGRTCMLLFLAVFLASQTALAGGVIIEGKDPSIIHAVLKETGRPPTKPELSNVDQQLYLWLAMSYQQAEGGFEEEDENISSSDETRRESADNVTQDDDGMVMITDAAPWEYGPQHDALGGCNVVPGSNSTVVLTVVAAMFLLRRRRTR